MTAPLRQVSSWALAKAAGEASLGVGLEPTSGRAISVPLKADWAASP